MKEFAMYLGTICFVVSIVCFVLAYKKKEKERKNQQIAYGWNWMFCHRGSSCYCI